MLTTGGIPSRDCFLRPGVPQGVIHFLGLVAAVVDIGHQKPAERLHIRGLREREAAFGERLYFIERPGLIEKVPRQKEIALRSLWGDPHHLAHLITRSLPLLLSRQ